MPAFWVANVFLPAQVFDFSMFDEALLIIKRNSVMSISKITHYKGILLAIFSTFSFALMQLFTALTHKDISVVEQLFFRNLIGLLVAGAFAYQQRISFYGDRRYRLPLLIRSATGCLSVLLLFYASRNAAQADVAILSRMSMFTISAVSVAFLHEKLTKIHIPVMLVAFLGAFIAANPHFDSSFLPLLAAFGTAILDSICCPTISYLSDKVDSVTVVMFFCTFSTVVSIPLMLPVFVFPTGWNFFCLLMIGIFAAIGQITMTLSYRYAPAGELSVYNQMSIIFSAVLGYLFLNEIPSIRTVIGGTLVIFASFILVSYKRHTALND